MIKPDLGGVEPHLTFVTTIATAGCVKFSNMFMKETALKYVIFQNIKFTQIVQFQTRCGVLHTVYNFTHSVSFYTQCEIFLTVCNFTHSV